MFDEPRADDAAICPFLRHERGALVAAPLPVPDAANACIATGEPRPQSLRQQELLCLHLSHADCPRYLRGGNAGSEAIVDTARRASRLPRATGAALLVLVLSAGLSFGFVLRRGGIELPSFAAPSGGRPSATAPSSTTAAVVPSRPAESSKPRAATQSPDVTAGPSATPEAVPSPSPSASPAPSPTPGPTPTPPTVQPGSASRMKLVTACPGVADCYIYKVATYGTVVEIADFFGVSTKRIFALNPGLNPRTIKHGQAIRIPTPTK
jgi:LysM repeat protein